MGDKEREVTWFCSWLSDVEADGSSPGWDVRRKLQAGMEESGEEMERKGLEIRRQRPVTSHGGSLQAGAGDLAVPWASAG